MEKNVLTYDTPITMVIDSPTRRTKFPYGMGRTAADVYAYQVLNPVRNYDKSTSFSYTYGGRLRDFNGVDQLNVLVDRLTSSKSSRRAVVSFYDPVKDGPRVRTLSEPFTDETLVKRWVHSFYSAGIQDTRVRGSLNVYGIIAVMDKVRSGLPSAPGMGRLYITSNIPHIYYTRDADVLNRVMGEIKVAEPHPYSPISSVNGSDRVSSPEAPSFTGS